MVCADFHHLTGHYRADAPQRSLKTKEIINNISIRSNQQNPIKAWNLRANDDFQMELYRRFRLDGMFYERRDKEWKTRSAQLRGVGVSRGPSIKALMAQVSCYHWKRVGLGPTIAKSQLGELFQGDGYDVIRRETSPELAFQIHLLFDLVSAGLGSLTLKKYKNAKRHIDLVVLSLVCRALTDEGAPWRKSEWTEFLKSQPAGRQRTDSPWASLARSASDVVLDRYSKAQKLGQRAGDELTLKNFVRRKDETNRLFSDSLPASLRSASRRVVASSRVRP